MSRNKKPKKKYKPPHKSGRWYEDLKSEENSKEQQRLQKIYEKKTRGSGL